MISPRQLTEKFPTFIFSNQCSDIDFEEKKKEKEHEKNY